MNDKVKENFFDPDFDSLVDKYNHYITKLGSFNVPIDSNLENLITGFYGDIINFIEKGQYRADATTRLYHLKVKSQILFDSCDNFIRNIDSCNTTEYYGRD